MFPGADCFSPSIRKGQNCAEGHPVNAGCPDVAVRAQQLLEASLLAELQTVVTRALSGMDMFSGTQLEQVLGHEPALPSSQVAEAGLVSTQSSSPCCW